MQQGHVTITEDGRSGTVLYTEGTDQLRFFWEFGGGEALAIIQVSDHAAWAAIPAWLAGRRGEVLRFVAQEVVRQRAPNSRAEIDEVSGSITLVQGTTKEHKRQEAAAWMGRYSKLRGKLGIVVLIGGLGAAVLFWLKNKVLTVDPGKGTPLGLSVRTDKHIATLIQSLEAYTPSLHRSGGDDRYSFSLFLVPLNGADQKLIPFAKGLSPNGFTLSKILGSDGNILWFDAPELHGLDLRSLELLSDEAVQHVDPNTLPKPWNGAPFEPKPEEFLAAGLFTGPNTWLGLHSPMEAARDLKPKHWLKRIVHAENKKELRVFHRGTLDPDTSDDHHRILSVATLGEATYVNAAFLRMSYASEPIRLSDPLGGLMMYTSDAGLRGTAMLARVDTTGTVLWNADTGIDRFTLQQILPGEASTVFVGTRPPVPDKVSEPILVIVDNSSGAVRTVSLWQ